MNVPKLRFKGHSGGEIKLFTIKDIANIQVGRDLIEDSFSEIKTDKYCYPVYSNTIVNRGLYGFYDFEEYDGNSLTVVGRGAGLGTAFARNSGFGAIGRLLIISPKSNEFNVSYFAEYVNFKLRIHNESGGIPQLPGSTFGNYTIVLPPLPEQTKIANFLTAIDEKISQLTQKCDLLKQYKKGVMQQIFSQKLRFKDVDGREFPEWEATTLGEVTELFSRRNKNLVDAKIYSVTNSNGFVLQTEHFEDRVIVGSDLSSYKIIYKGEFAYNPARVNVGSIALFTEQVGVISSLYVCFKCKPSLDNTFLLNYLELDSTKQNINSFGEGGVRIYLWYPLFSQIPITLPSLKEQTKIANFLTVIDDKITHTQTQLDAVKQYKKGLLQQLFV